MSFLSKFINLLFFLFEQPWFISFASGLSISRNLAVTAVRLFFYILLISLFSIPIFVDFKKNDSIIFGIFLSLFVFLLKLLLWIGNKAISSSDDFEVEASFVEVTDNGVDEPILNNNEGRNSLLDTNILENHINGEVNYVSDHKAHNIDISGNDNSKNENTKDNTNSSINLGSESPQPNKNLHKKRIKILKCPEGISQELWEMRSIIPLNKDIPEEIFMHFINKGFELGEVLSLIRIVKSLNVDESNLESSSKAFRPKIISKLTLFGRQFTIPFTRAQLNSIFPENYSLYYCFLSFIVCVALSISSVSISRFFSRTEYSFMILIYGPAVYSILAPPEVDPYSCTRGDPYTGLSRPFTLSALNFVVLYLETNNEIPESITELVFDIDISFFIPIMRVFFRISLLTFPLWSIFFLSHPSNIFTWTLEAIGSYIFGISATTGAMNCLLIILKSGLLVTGSHWVLSNSFTSLTFSLVVSISLFILQIPTSIYVVFNKRFLGNLVVISLVSLVSFVSCLVATSSRAFISRDIIYYLSLSSIALLDIVWPYLNSISNYVIFCMRVFDFNFKTIRFLRLTTPAIWVPLLLGACLSVNDIKTKLTSYLIIALLNKSLTEPFMIPLSMFVQSVTLGTEFGLKNRSIGLIYSIIIVKKLYSVCSVTSFFARNRFPYFYSRFMFFNNESIYDRILIYFICKFLIICPFVDKVISISSYIWSFITGAPFHCPQKLPSISFPFPPRAATFWPTFIVSNKFNTLDLLTSHRTEHPIEAPVYTSMCRSLSSSLHGIINSGRLGMVTSDSFYLFYSDPLAAFVHIISLEANCIRFQVRGLEYNDETICHLSEVARIKNDLDLYRDRRPNFASAFNYTLTNWKAISKNLQMYQYTVSKFDYDTAFIGVSSSMSRRLAALCFVSTNNYRPGTNDDDADLTFATETFGLIDQYDVQYFMDFYNSIFTNDLIDKDKLLEKFHQEDHSFSDSIQMIIIVFALISMSLGPSIEVFQSVGSDIGPSDESKLEIKEFLASVKRNYIVAPIESQKFRNEFDNAKHDLVSFEQTKNGPSLLFFRRQSVSWNVLKVDSFYVRSFWASEAFSQIYLGEDNSERLSIQEDGRMMRNLITQVCDKPIGYPAYVSSITPSYTLSSIFRTF